MKGRHLEQAGVRFWLWRAPKAFDASVGCRLTSAMGTVLSPISVHRTAGTGRPPEVMNGRLSGTKRVEPRHVCRTAPENREWQLRVGYSRWPLVQGVVRKPPGRPRLEW